MRKLLVHISPLLLASSIAGGFIVTSALPATAEGRDERRDRLHAMRPIAAMETLETAGLTALAEQAARDQEAFFAAVAAAEAEAAAVAAATAPRGAAPAPTATSGGCNGDTECFLECTRGHESDSAGGYGAVSSGGTYRGAYQFNQHTWDAAAAGAGHGEYAGAPADAAPPEVQDAAAAHLYSQSGNRPWGGRC